MALLDRLAIDQAAVVGLSMGGYVAIQLLAHWPERISAVVLADTMGRGDTEERKQARAAQAEVIRAEGSGAVRDAGAAANVRAERASRSDPALVERFRDTITGQRPEAVVAALQGIATRPEMLDALASVDCPTLVLVGSKDAATPPDASRELAAAIQGSALVVLPDAGHMSCWEDPAGFNAAVRDFLDRTVEHAEIKRLTSAVP